MSMHWPQLMLSVLVVCLLALFGGAAAADLPATAPAEPLIGEMNVQTVAGQTFFYCSKQTTFDKLKETAAELMPKLTNTIKEKKVQGAGPVVFVYRGMGPDMSKPFTLEVGQLVAADTAAAGDCQVRKLDAFHCATMLCTGPLEAIALTFQKLMPAIFAKHLMPTDESREYYLYWEGPESPNNVVQVQVGLK